MKKGKNNTLLWRISGEDLMENSYLLGTMHVKDKRAFGNRDIIIEKIDVCKAFATEFSLSEAYTNVNANSFDLPNEKVLADFISEKKYNKLKGTLNKYFEVDIDIFSTMLPLIIMNALSAKLLNEDEVFSLDEYLWRYAFESEKITLGIETLEEQQKVLSQVPLDYQFKMLFDAVKNISSFKKKHKKLMSMYERGDIAQLYKTTKKGLGSMKRLMLYNRNEIMAERIAKMAEEQSLFAAVGAAHLGGKRGILRLLKTKGLTVLPV